MFHTKDEYYDETNCKKDDIYRTLSIVVKHKDSLMKHLNKRMVEKYNRKIKHTFYDVTNFYFEIDNNDQDEFINDEIIVKGLRKKGLSKENRDLPIVQMGMLLDDQGFPISYDTFPGNQTDITTLRPFLAKYKKLFDANDITIVADKGLNSKGNLGYIDESGNKYVVAQKVRGAPKKLIDDFLNSN
jgi:transposase